MLTAKVPIALNVTNKGVKEEQQTKAPQPPNLWI